MSAQAIPYRYYFEAATGRRVSIFSSWPHATTPGWEVITKGFSIMWPDNTCGVLPMGRGPFDTEQEAAACIAANPNFKGFQQD